MFPDGDGQEVYNVDVYELVWMHFIWTLDNQGINGIPDSLRETCDLLPFSMEYEKRVYNQQLAGSGGLRECDSEHLKNEIKRIEATHKSLDWSNLYYLKRHFFPPETDFMEQFCSASAQACELLAGKAKTVSKRGRPPVSVKEAQKRRNILDRWNRRKDAGVPRKDFCEDEGIRIETLEKYQEWANTRRKRGK